jgi:hypothetical protein
VRDLYVALQDKENVESQIRAKVTEKDLENVAEITACQGRHRKEMEALKKEHDTRVAILEMEIASIKSRHSSDVMVWEDRYTEKEDEITRLRSNLQKNEEFIKDLLSRALVAPVAERSTVLKTVSVNHGEGVEDAF